jgi:hypothetical protein
MVDCRGLLSFLTIILWAPALISGSKLHVPLNSSSPFRWENSSHSGNASSLYPSHNLSTSVSSERPFATGLLLLPESRTGWVTPTSASFPTIKAAKFTSNQTYGSFKSLSEDSNGPIDLPLNLTTSNPRGTWQNSSVNFSNSTNQTYDPPKTPSENSNAPVHLPLNFSTSSLKEPWQNGSSSFFNSPRPSPMNVSSNLRIPSNLTNSTPMNVSSMVPIQASADKNENTDLYPPDVSNVTIKHRCHQDLTRPLLPRQSSSEADMYPPLYIACDAGYFEFSEENIEKSGVIDWYSRWTIEAREKYIDKYRDLGEWRLFYRWWLQEYDFRCGYDFASCTEEKSRQDIQKIYPGEENKNLARKIYFVTRMYEYMHQHTRMMDVRHFTRPNSPSSFLNLPICDARLSRSRTRVWFFEIGLSLSLQGLNNT